MDATRRQMTKIAREVGKFTVQMMKEEGIGTAEFDVIHFIRHNPGVTQTEVRENLKIDRGAAAKRVAIRATSSANQTRMTEEASFCTRQRRQRN